MSDFKEGIKKEISEVKFLIHDLRVGRSVNEIIHFHGGLDTDLEIHGIDEVQAMHGEDFDELKRQALSLRKAERDYQNVVRSFSPDSAVLLAGKRYIRKIREVSELILNPHWGRIDKVLSFLPADARSVQARNHYRNHIRWIAGVHSRIERFIDEMRNKDLIAEFDIASELEDCTRNVIHGYVAEKSRARIEINLEGLDSAVLEGNPYRFRRMYFNLIMNAVDAMSHLKVGVIKVTTSLDGDRVVLQVQDHGTGMSEEKIQQLLSDRETLDGDLHSLGFVFVRQTIADFGGELSIQTSEGEGTTVTVRLPYIEGAEPPKRQQSEWKDYNILREVDRVPRRAREGGPSAAAGQGVAPSAPVRPEPVSEDRQTHCGAMVYQDYQTCQAEFPGCIFGIAVTEEGRVEFFTHRPYERYFNISHEDLSPMFFEATVRGRLEEDEEKKPVLILKSPQNLRDYFEFKEVDDGERNAALYERMVRDEYIRIGRLLIETGLPPETGVLLSDIQRFLGDCPALLEEEPFPLQLLADQTLAAPAKA